MAKSKKPAVEAPVNRAFEHGKNAFGAKYVRPGYARTPELDLAFALGHGGGAFGPIELLPDIAPGKRITKSYTSMHRNVALAMLRTNEQTPTLEENPKPLDEKEAVTLLRRQLGELWLSPNVWRAVEAMVGPSVVLPAFIDGMEKVKKANWDNSTMDPLFPMLYGLMLRVPKKESLEARARLEDIYEKKKNVHAGIGLDKTLHGVPAIRANGYKYSSLYKSFQQNDSSDPSNTFDLCFCDGEPEFVAANFQQLWEALKWKVMGFMSGPALARLFFVGGAETFKTELRVVDLYKGKNQRAAFDSYADFHPSHVKPLIERLAKPGSKVQKLAEAWLESNT